MALPYLDDSREMLTELASAIELKRCTPFLGAGACHGLLPTGAELAETLASDRDYPYPFEDKTNLARVAQFAEIRKGRLTTRKLILDMIAQAPRPNFEQPDEPHRFLAELALPLYLTTNYDDFMYRALIARGKEGARRAVCAWNRALRESPDRLRPDVQISEDKPLVFHLHGDIRNVDSMVLTEDDYLGFLVSLSENRQVLPYRIQQAFTETCLMFLGYSLSDWNFLVILEKLDLSLSGAPRHVAVQLEPLKDATGEMAEAARRHATAYLERRLATHKISVFWGTCRDFVRELRSCCEARGVM